MEEEKEGEREEGGKGAAGKQLPAGRGEQEKSAPSGERWGGFVNCGGDSGGLLEKYFLAVLDDDALVVGTDGLTCKVVGWGIGC